MKRHVVITGNHDIENSNSSGGHVPYAFNMYFRQQERNSVTEEELTFYGGACSENHQAQSKVASANVVI